jgi:phosphoribosylglycinamide formyltransferase-1
MRAILAAAQAGDLQAEPKLLIASNPTAKALEVARDAGVPTAVVDHRALDPNAADESIASLMQDAGAELLVLSGFMRKLGPATLEAFRGRILNIHPSLLPAFGGHGMYGRRVHEAVHAAGAAVTGATIHLVDEEYDTGPVLAQAQAPITPGDTAADIEAKVRTIEPLLFVQTLKAISRGDLKLPA